MDVMMWRQVLLVMLVVTAMEVVWRWGGGLGDALTNDGDEENDADSSFHSGGHSLSVFIADIVSLEAAGHHGSDMLHSHSRPALTPCDTDKHLVSRNTDERCCAAC